MVRHNWSVNILGFPAHTRSAAPVIAISDMTTHEALRFAESVGLFTGWLATESPQPQLQGVMEGEAQWVSLAELFVERRIVATDGVVSGTVVFVASVPADGSPPADRSLITWAEELGHPWILVVDNECTYWGNLNDIQTDALLRWFCSQHPVEQRWQDLRFDTSLARVLQRGLFEHGWTRNTSLVTGGRKPQLQLWGGLHGRSILEPEETHLLSAVGHGLDLTLRTSTWTAERIEGTCPIDEVTGRVLLQPLD